MKTATKSKTYKQQSRANFPTRQCSKCRVYYHARAKECPDCGEPNETRVTNAASGPSPEPTAKKTSRAKHRVTNRLPKETQTPRPIDAAITFVSQAGGLGPAKQAMEMLDRIRALEER